MIEKLTQAEEGGGAGPPPFNLFTITFEVAKYVHAERADTLPLFHLSSYMYSVLILLGSCNLPHLFVLVSSKNGNKNNTSLSFGSFFCFLNLLTAVIVLNIFKNHKYLTITTEYI